MLHPRATDTSTKETEGNKTRNCLAVPIQVVSLQTPQACSLVYVFVAQADLHSTILLPLLPTAGIAGTQSQAPPPSEFACSGCKRYLWEEVPCTGFAQSHPE